MDIFKGLTDQMYELYESCKRSGFTDSQAFDLTKTYCSCAFVNQAIETRNDYYKQHSRTEMLRRYRERGKTEENEK